MRNKKYVISAVAIVLGLSALGATTIYAQTNAGVGFGPMNNLANVIATKFNLNVSDVQAVFDDERKQMDAQRGQDYIERIKQAVTDGKLTQDQADKILAKKAELEAQRASLVGKTLEERKALQKTHMDALKQWATDNNIPQEFMPFGGGFGMGKGHGKGGPSGMGFRGPSFNTQNNK